VSQKFGAFVGVSTLLSLAASPGMFHASGALLPSATVMQLVMLSLSQSLLVAPTPSPESKNGARGSETLAIFYGLIATLCVGWPFSAALFIPLGLQAIYRAWSRPTGKVASVLGLLSRTALHAILVQCVVTLVDHNFYNTVIFPSWNILRYNVMQGDDELYGVEPFSYYVKNLLLGFNVVAVMAFIAILLLFLELAFNQTRQKMTLEKLYALSPMVIWLLWSFFDRLSLQRKSRQIKHEAFFGVFRLRRGHDGICLSNNGSALLLCSSHANIQFAVLRDCRR
jgi:alpha-1,2-mannosyltransferase